MPSIDPAARFLDVESGEKGSGRSMNKGLGRVSGGCPNWRRQALGNPRMDPDVTSRCFSPLTNASRKVVIFPGAKNLSLIRLISALRSSVDVNEELVGLGKVNYKKTTHNVGRLTRQRRVWT